MFTAIKKLISLKAKTPVILQSELAECGLACVAMILGHYGNNLSLSELRRQNRSSLKGLTLQQLVKIATGQGLAVQVLRLDIHELQTVKLPCIMHWNMNHFLVITDITDDYVFVNDPGLGKRKLKKSELLKGFTGIVLELVPANMNPLAAKPMNHAQGLMLKTVKKYWPLMLKLLLVSCLIQFFYIVAVVCSKHAIDNSIVNFQSKLLWVCIIAFVGTKLAEYSATALRLLMVTVTGTLLNASFGLQVMQKLFKLPLGFFENRHVGDILSRFGAIDKVRNILTEGLIEGLVDGVVSLITLIAMLNCNFKIALIVVSFSSFYIVIKCYANIKIKALNEEALHAKASEVSYFMESMRAMAAIKLFHKEKNRLRRWKNKFVRSLNATSKITLHKAITDFIKNTVYGIDMSLVLVLGCYYLNQGVLTMGMLYAFIAYRQQFILAVGNLADKAQDFRLLKLHLERLDDIMGEENELAVVPVCRPMKLKNQLRLSNVCFIYPMDNFPVIDNFNLSVRAGECVAITGPSGKGKTTLLKIMMGLLKPTSGSVDIDGRAIYPSDVRLYRQNISAVMQEDVLLSGSILENICFFAQSPDIAKIKRCAVLAGIWQEINAFPMGLNTLIGDMGSVLSGGQKQRILLARALYREPQILFLDEASSHLDVAKEREINRALRDLNITIIMIAHRKETIAMADRIIDLREISLAAS